MTNGRRSRRSRWMVASSALAVVLVASGCGHSKSMARVVRRATTTTSSSTTTLLPPPATTTSTAAPKAVTTVAVSDGTVDVPQLRGVQAKQGVVVIAGGYGQTTATLTTYTRVGSMWRPVSGPWTARVGTRGIAPAGAKREGDLRTPSGTYGFGFTFGVLPNPGVRLEFRRITSSNIVWVDDSSSPLYNTWVDKSQQSPGADPEPMYNQPAYDLGAVIAYNTARTPGMGSAIFLHTATGRATAGCVSLPASQLRSVLLWLDPAQAPVISISVG